MTSSFVIQAQALCVEIEHQAILENLDFNVAKGEVYALLGGNGAGKSSTLKTFLGFNQPSAGKAIIDGREVHRNITQCREQMAYLPENASLYPHLTAFENIEYFLSLAGIKQSRQQIEQALHRVALQTEAWQQPLQTYSKGMRQKTAIALAILRSAPIFLLDEPTSGLDPVAIDEFNQLITELAENGATILMVTHDVYGACQVANRIGLLRGGRLVGEFAATKGEKINTEQVHQAFSQQQGTSKEASAAVDQ